MHEVIIVGSGAAGVSAGLGFAGHGITPLILDVGYLNERGDNQIIQNFYDYKKEHDSYDLTIGENFQGLHNLAHPDEILPVKLTAPRMEFVTRSSQHLSPIYSSKFNPIQSFAAGGLANAWGAGLYRFLDRELEHFPIDEDDLVSYFDRLTDEIGISGVEDDLQTYFGNGIDLLDPLELSYNASRFYRAYSENRKYLNSRGFYVGRPRLAVLTQDHNGRRACNYTNLEFWQPGLPYIYTPLFTLQKLVQERRVNHWRNHLVKSFKEDGGTVLIKAKNLSEDSEIELRCKRLVLAAGAINSAKIVLSSRHDHETQLPLLDNPAIQIPLLFPRSVGRETDVNAFGLVQLNMILENNIAGELLQGSIMEITSPMRAEFYSSLPFSAQTNLNLLRYLLPAMMLIQLFFPSSIQRPARLQLRKDGAISIEGEDNSITISEIKPILSYLRKLGAYSHPAIIVKVPTGHSIHYAGTLPMKDQPITPYECHPNGLLHLTKNVYVVDGANFPTLPAKNYSFAMMANAMRIAENISRELRM